MKPKVVCLVGSSRFKAEFHRKGEELEKSGVLVLMMSFFQHADNIPVSDKEREVLEVVDRYRVELADELFVVNPKTHVCVACRKPCEIDTIYIHTGYISRSKCCKDTYTWQPYIGESTKKEVAHALLKGKPVSSLHPLELA